MAEIVLDKAAKFRLDNQGKIDIYSDEIGKKIDKNSRITNATLVLQVATVTGSGFEVKVQSDGKDFEIIDYIYPASGDTVFLNITEELNDIMKNVNATVVIQITEGITFESGIELKVEYIPERIMHTSNSYYDIDAGRAGSGKVNTTTGALNFVHSDSEASGISHVYNTWQANRIGVDFDYPDISEEVKEALAVYGDYGCGKGWKLNLHQYLVKRKGTESQDLYTYVDGSGNYHEFTEKYYYTSNEVKIYLDKEDVIIGFDGELSYEGMEVKPELRTTSGLILQTDYQGFAGTEKLELRSEDRARIEDDILSLERTIEDCKFSVEEYEKAENINYKKLIELQELIDSRSAELEYKNLDIQNRTADIIGRSNGINVLGGLFDQKMELDHVLEKDINGEYQGELGRNLDLKKVAYDTSIDTLRSKSSIVAEEQAYAVEEYPSSGPPRSHLLDQNRAQAELNKAQKAFEDAQKVLSAKIDYLQQEIREKSNEIERINKDAGEELELVKKELIDLQDDFRGRKKEYNKSEENRQAKRNDDLKIRANYDLSKAQNLLDYRRFELSNLEAQEPVRFIIGGEGTVMGFNEAGVMMVVADAYENSIYINYDAGKIIGMKDTDGKETKFEYENGYLNRIIDAEEKIIRFDYSANGTLVAILYPDGSNSVFNYIWESGLLHTATNPSGYGVKFSYEAQKIQKIEEMTQTYEITSDGWRGFNDEEEEKEYCPRTLAQIQYNTHFSSTLTDYSGNKKTYIFDIFGKPATIYEGEYYDYGENTKSLSIDYNGVEQAFSIADNFVYDNILKKTDGVQLTGELFGDFTQVSQKVYDVDIADLPKEAANLVFSAWVKADSAFVPSERKTGYSISKIDEQNEDSDIFKKRRKFGLRAKLEFVDDRGIITKEEFSATFDWINTGWQYLALPVAIREDDKMGDRIVGRFPFKLGDEDRRLTKLKVIIDYSYNVNGRYDGTEDEKGNKKHTGMAFDCVTLREGDWTYSKIEPDGKVNCTEESGNETITFFDYDKSGNVVKETVKDKQYRNYISTYEYNKQNKLIRSTDFSGLCEETVYDDKGRTVKSMTYNIADPTSKFYSESVRDEKGRVTADIDITGEFNSAEYEFDNTGAVKAVKDALGNKTSCGYHNGALVSVSGSADGEENKNTLKHTLGLVTCVSSGGTDYTYTYDGWGRQKEIKIADVMYSITEHLNDKTTVVCLATGEKFKECELDKNDDVVEVVRKEDGNPKTYRCRAAETYYAKDGMDEPQLHTVRYVDIETGWLIRSVDKNNETEYTVDYYYDKEGRLIFRQEDGLGSLEQTIQYNAKGEVTNSSFIVNDNTGAEQEYTYEYESTLNDKQVSIGLPGGAKQTIGYDGLGRLTNISLCGEKFTKDIYYAKYGDHATKAVSSVWYGLDGNRSQNTRYSYDKNGNITCVKENGKEVARYTYDGLNRLIREDNAVYREKAGDTTAGKTETYEYDNNGNILVKTKYPYTLKDILSGGKRTEYGYRQSGWRDQLISFDGQTIGDYDNLGNPREYRGNPLKWEKGRNLVQYGNETYIYNAAGTRTSKTANGIETTYYLDGSKIIAEERRDLSKLTGDNLIDTVYYHYGIEGAAAFSLNDEQYFYRKNIQGDVTHIYTDKGKQVAEYIYDAHGNCSVCAVAGYEELAERNPLRYRSYYYDTTTQLYYLNSRYYDPQTGRFINADAIAELDPETINGLNLYAYCGNNYIMLVDSEGNAPKWWQWLVSGALLVVGTILCATGVGTALGVSLLVAGGSMMASNIMSAAGVDGKLATIISAGLNIIAGIALCFTPFAAIGASMIGSGVGSIAGGFISEWAGGSFEMGAMIGGIIGGIVGGQVHKGISAAVAGKVATAAKSVSDSADEVGQGFDKFSQLKKHLGPAGENRDWHHIVEQSQIGKSGFSSTQINNTKNIIAIDKGIHRQISGYYSSIQKSFTQGQTVRNWLSGQSFQRQYDFGIKVLKMFGVLL